MKNAREWLLGLVVLSVVPAYAQEEPYDEPAEEAAAEEAAPDEYSAEEAAPAEEAPAEESYAEPAPDEEGIETTPAGSYGEPLDTVPVDDAEEPAEIAEDAEPLPVYVGVDLSSTTLSSSTLPGFPAGEYDSGIYRLRAGARVLDDVSLEFQYGVDAAGDEAGDAATETYYGLFAVPAANLFDIVELAFPVGYAVSSVERAGASDDLGSVAYGVNVELPLRAFAEDWPDIRLGAGWMVYYQKRDARLYGWTAGLRYDFDFYNPFGDYELDLWPFGDDED